MAPFSEYIGLETSLAASPELLLAHAAGRSSGLAARLSGDQTQLAPSAPELGSRL